MISTTQDRKTKNITPSLNAPHFGSLAKKIRQNSTQRILQSAPRAHLYWGMVSLQSCPSVQVSGLHSGLRL